MRVQTLVVKKEKRKKKGWLGGLATETHPRPSVPACVRSANSLFNARTILILLLLLFIVIFLWGWGEGGTSTLCFIVIFLNGVRGRWIPGIKKYFKKGVGVGDGDG